MVNDADMICPNDCNVSVEVLMTSTRAAAPLSTCTVSCLGAGCSPHITPRAR